MRQLNYLCPNCDTQIFFELQPYYHNEKDYIFFCKKCGWRVERDGKFSSVEDIIKSLKLKPVISEKKETKKEYNYMKGWLCPKCGSVYSPFVSECKRCNKPYNNIIYENLIY